VTSGFKVGEAYIDVDADADAAVAKIRRQLKSAKGPLSLIADEIGDDFGRRLGSNIEKHMKATKGRIGSIATATGNDAGSKIVSTMDKQLRGAKGRLGQSASEIGSAIGAKVSTALSKDLGGKLDATLGAKAKQAGTAVGSALGDGVDSAAAKSVSSSSKTKSALNSVAERSQAQFKGLVFAGAFAGLPVAAGAAAAATIAALGIVPIALAAGAAKIQAGNEDVARSYSQLGNTATTVMTEASSVLTSGLVKGTDRLTKGMLDLKPAMTGAFKLAAPAIDGVVDSVLVLTHEALPGVVTGLTKTEDAMRGVTALSQGIGRGVSDFFANISTGSASAATNAGTLGRMLQDLLGASGQLLANLSNGGTTILPTFANALSQIYGIVLTLTGAGMSPLVSGVSGFITVVSGALGVVQALTSGLGGWLGPLAMAVGAFKAMDMLTFGKLTTGLSGVGTKLKEAEGARGKFAAGMSALGDLFTPGNIAAAALTVGLGFLGAAQQRAAQEAAEHKTRISDLSSALRDSKGAIDDNVRATAAKSLADMKAGEGGKNVLQIAREIGVSLPLVTDAYLGNAGAADELNGKLNALKIAHTDESGAMDTVAYAADDMQRALYDNRGEIGASVQANKDLAAASAATAASVKSTTPAMEQAAASSATLRNAWTTMYTPLASVTDKVNALIGVMDRLNGRTPSFEEAIQSSNDILRNMASSLTDTEFAANGFGDALLNSDGTVSTWTKNGSDLQNNLVGLQSGFATAATSIHGLVQGGMTYEAAAKQVNSTLQVQRDEFVALAQKMGLSADQAKDLATKYGLLPKEAVTMVTDYGSAVNTQKDVDTLTSRLKSMPPDTPVRITSITAEAEKKLIDMNYTVTHMSDGTVVVFSNTTNAESGIGRVKSGMDSLTDKTVTVTYRTVYTTSGVPVAPRGEAQAALNATGGYQFSSARRGGPRTRATGGTLPALPGMAGAAWTGERGPELSFPSQTSYIATNQQSMDLLRRAKSADLALERTVNIKTPDPAVAPNITINMYITPPPSMDIDALTAKVSRSLERTLKGGR